jgi:hypothetical protein
MVDVTISILKKLKTGSFYGLGNKKVPAEYTTGTM